MSLLGDQCAYTTLYISLGQGQYTPNSQVNVQRQMQINAEVEVAIAARVCGVSDHVVLSLNQLEGNPPRSGNLEHMLQMGRPRRERAVAGRVARARWKFLLQHHAHVLV
eukprot:scpid78362/ scgid32425/ 